jgi:hypothetical protein
MAFYVMAIILGREEHTAAGGRWVNPPTYVRCQACQRPVLAPPETVEIELERVGRAGFVEVLYAFPAKLFRNDVIAAWRASGFTGFSVRPVQIVGWAKGKEKRSLPDDIPTYWQLVLDSKAALGSPPVIERCDACGFVQYADPGTSGLHVDASTWDGSSIFGIHGMDHVLCVREVAEVTLRSGFGKSIPFVSAELYRSWGPFSVAEWGDDVKAYNQSVEGCLIRRVKDL